MPVVTHVLDTDTFVQWRAKTNELIDILNMPTTGNVQQLATRVGTFTVLEAAGVHIGCVVTENGDGTVSVTSGEALLRSSNSAVAPLTACAIPAANNITMVDQATNYIYADYNAGSPVIANSTVAADVNDRDKVLIAVVSRANLDVAVLQIAGGELEYNRNLNHKMRHTEGFKRAAGGKLTSPAPLKLKIEAGEFYYGINEFLSAAVDTSLTGTFEQFYYGAAGWAADPAVGADQTVNSTQYNQWGVGLTAMTASWFRTDWVYLKLSTNKTGLYTIMGQAQHSSEAEAKNDVPPTDVPVELQALGVLVGRIIVQQGAANIVRVESTFNNTSFAASAASEFSDGSFKLFDNLIPGKKVSFQLDGISDATERVFEFPNKSDMIATRDDVFRRSDEPYKTAAQASIAPRVAPYDGIPVQYMPLEEGTSITKNGAMILQDLKKESVGTITGILAGDILSANKPCVFKDQDYGTMLPALTMLGENYWFYSNRGAPTNIYIYAPHHDVIVDYKNNSNDFTTPDQTITIEHGKVGIIVATLEGHHYVRANGPILMNKVGMTGNVDHSCVYPMSREILFPGGDVRVDFTGVTGTFQVGDVITGGTSGATGYIQSTNGTTYAYITNITGEFVSGETVTASVSGATATTTPYYNSGASRTTAFYPGGTVEHVGNGYYISDNSIIQGMGITDGAGGNGHTGIPYKMLGDTYGISHDVLGFQILAIDPGRVRAFCCGILQYDIDMSTASKTSPFFYARGSTHTGSATGLNPTIGYLPFTYPETAGYTLFTIGETITGGTSGATAVVYGDEPGRFVLTSVTGTFQVGETVTGGTSGATGTVSATIYRVWQFFGNVPFAMRTNDYASDEYIPLGFRASERSDTFDSTEYLNLQIHLQEDFMHERADWITNFDDDVDFKWENATGTGTVSYPKSPTVPGSSAWGVRQVDGYRYDVWATKIPFEPDTLYRFTARVRATALDSVGKALLYMGFAGWDRNYNYCNQSGLNTIGSQYYVLANGRDIALDGLNNWVTITGYVKGYGAFVAGGTNSASNPSGVHANVKFMRPIMLVNYPTGASTGGQIQLDWFKIEKATDEERLLAGDAAEAATRLAADNALDARSTALESWQSGTVDPHIATPHQPLLTGSDVNATAKLATGNWNSYIQGGFFVGNNLTNSPASPAGANTWRYVRVTRYAANWVLQEMTDFNNTACMWRRTLQNNVWGAWKRVDIEATDISVNSVTAAAALAAGTTVTAPTVQITDANTKLQKGAVNSTRIQTPSGYVDVGAQNATWAHIYTDRPGFYFNKDITVNGNKLTAIANTSRASDIWRHTVRWYPPLNAWGNIPYTQMTKISGPANWGLNGASQWVCRVAGVYLVGTNASMFATGWSSSCWQRILHNGVMVESILADYYQIHYKTATLAPFARSFNVGDTIQWQFDRVGNGNVYVHEAHSNITFTRLN